jgi:hypothetical protein
MNEKSVFSTLNAIDVSDKVKQKQNLSYLSWASCWAEVKKVYPNADYNVYPQIMDDFGNTRFWHDDGKTGWVEVGAIVNGTEHKMQLAIMDLRNNSIPAEKITSTDANKALMRCLVKAFALHGLGLYIYIGEDLPEDVSRANELRDKVAELAKKKAGLSDKAKEKVAEFCKAAEKKAFPDLPDDEITGNYNNIEDADILESLERQLMSVRK